MCLYDIEKGEPMASLSAWLEPRSHHKTYGNFYYLKPISSTMISSLNTYRKCVVFLKNYADFIELSPDNLPSPTRVPHSGTISNIIEDNSDDDSTQSPPEFIDNEIKHNLPFVSLIMFIENGEPFYCVKTESIFAELVT
jgi:hypothetical protein